MINSTTFQRIFLVGILLSAFALLSVIVFRYPTSEIWTLRARVAAGQTIKEADVRQLSLPTVVVERFGERIEPVHRRRASARTPIDAQLGDESIAGAGPLIRRNTQSHRINLSPGGAHKVVQPFAEQRAGLVQPRRVDHDQLTLRTIDQRSDGVACGLGST